ncbi:MAG: NADH dehydrogenase [Planctomycetes bacterium RBG_13_62_9]|nr:MAG: NADH dehydrogenase [Planctomycetes bacterium RBG_13_62_9]
MTIVFYISAALAIVATLLAITRANAVHALLYFICSLLATGVMFFVLGAPFVAALVVIVNAGAIIVLFVFVVMMLNVGPDSADRERASLRPRAWIGPALISVLLIVELAHSVLRHQTGTTAGAAVDAKQVGMALFGPYLLGVELASMLLLAGLLGAYHLGREGTGRS